MQSKSVRFNSEWYIMMIQCNGHLHFVFTQYDIKSWNLELIPTNHVKLIILNNYYPSTNTLNRGKINTVSSSQCKSWGPKSLQLWWLDDVLRFSLTFSTALSCASLIFDWISSSQWRCFFRDVPVCRPASSHDVTGHLYTAGRRRRGMFDSHRTNVREFRHTLGPRIRSLFSRAKDLH